MRVKKRDGVVRLTKLRLFARPLLLAVFVSLGTGVMSTRKSTLVDAVIPLGASSSKLSVSFSFARCGDNGAVNGALIGETPAAGVSSAPLTKT